MTPFYRDVFVDKELPCHSFLECGLLDIGIFEEVSGVLLCAVVDSRNNIGTSFLPSIFASFFAFAVILVGNDSLTCAFAGISTGASGL